MRFAKLLISPIKLTFNQPFSFLFYFMHHLAPAAKLEREAKKMRGKIQEICPWGLLESHLKGYQTKVIPRLGAINQKINEEINRECH